MATDLGFDNLWVGKAWFPMLKFGEVLSWISLLIVIVAS